eukprot:5983660-Prymnesium_polylepis.1
MREDAGRKAPLWTVDPICDDEPAAVRSEPAPALRCTQTHTCQGGGGGSADEAREMRLSVSRMMVTPRRCL